jgi:hypothetical protein
MKKGMGLATALLVALCSAPGVAGEFQLGVRLGKTWLKVDGDRLSSGNSVDESLMTHGVIAAYRWPKGALLEIGTASSFNIDFFNLNGLDQQWLGGGWQIDLNDDWRLTPKAGLMYTVLESSEEDLFESEPVDEFKDWVPYLETTLERRIGRHFGMALYLRENFEDWGSTRMWGLSLVWTFD